MCVTSLRPRSTTPVHLRACLAHECPGSDIDGREGARAGGPTARTCPPVRLVDRVLVCVFGFGERGIAVGYTPIWRRPAVWSRRQWAVGRRGPLLTLVSPSGIPRFQEQVPRSGATHFLRVPKDGDSILHAAYREVQLLLGAEYRGIAGGRVEGNCVVDVSPRAVPMDPAAIIVPIAVDSVFVAVNDLNLDIQPRIRAIEVAQGELAQVELV